MGVSHARLPLERYVDLKTRKVLTVNQVFQILLTYLDEGSWAEAIMKVLPPRKGAVLLPEGQTEEGAIETSVHSRTNDAAGDIQ